MNAFVQHFSFEFQTGLRSKSHLLLNYLLPLGFYFMMGAVMTGINPFFRETMIPAMLVFAALSGAILGLPNPLVEAREGGVLRSYRINGVPAASILGIPALTTGLHLLAVGLIITVTAPLLFDAPLPLNLPLFFLTYLLTLFACCSLGLLIGVVSSNTQATVMWSQLIYLPSMLLGGLMVPTEILPPALQKAAFLLPSTHAMNAFKSLSMGIETVFPPWWSLLILFVVGLLGSGLNIKHLNSQSELCRNSR
jgi:ABC-2 type transport system permease protein